MCASIMYFTPHLNSPSTVFYIHFNPLNTKLNSICHLLALLGAHPFLHIDRIRVNALKRNPIYAWEHKF